MAKKYTNALGYNQSFIRDQVDKAEGLDTLQDIWHFVVALCQDERIPDETDEAWRAVKHFAYLKDMDEPEYLDFLETV